MIKVLIPVLVVLLVTSGAVSAAAAGVDENTLESLQLWTRQLFQEQVELQAQEQTQTKVEASQQKTSQNTPLQTRLMQENQEMLKTQDCIQSQVQFQLKQAIGPQDGTGYQWGMEVPASGNSYGPGSSPNPVHIPQTGDGSGTQQRGKP
jgi:hypothetical protein